MPNTIHSRSPTSDVARYSLLALLLTSVHHAYGAFIYSTPWRLHVVFVTGTAALIILGALAVQRAHLSDKVGTAARWLFVAVVLAVPILFFGVFEGFYNHVLKDVLFYAGLPTNEMVRLFPPPRYEMPNDAFFEITGVLQVVPSALAARHLYRLLADSHRIDERPNRPASPTRERNHSEEDAHVTI
jgi:hypothetical protein